MLALITKSVRWIKRPSRLLVAMLVVTNILTVALLMHNDAAVKTASDYPLINVARDIIPQEDFIVNIQPLREKMREIVGAKAAGTVSVYFEFLNTGANIQISDESRFYPASLVKLPCAMAVMKNVESGIWHLDDRFVLMAQDTDERYGTLYQQHVGTDFSIAYLLQQLLVESDNTAHNILMRNLSEANLSDLESSIGLEELFDEKQEISAKEYSRMFRSLYNASYLKREESQYILDLLTKTKFNSFMPSGVPDGTTFAHKIGEDDVENNFLDSGIVYYKQRPYLLTIMIKKHDQAAAKHIMKQLSAEAYSYVSEAKN